MAKQPHHGVKITPDAARRMARAVISFERGDRDRGAQRIRTAYSDAEGLRICKTGDEKWEPKTAATLEVWENGDPADPDITPDATIEAYNLSQSVDPHTLVLVQQAENGNYYLVEASERGLRICKTTGHWAKGTSASLTVWDSFGSNVVSASELTITAYNETHDVPADTLVIVGQTRHGDYYLIEQDNGCDEGYTRSTWLDPDAENDTTVDWSTDGGGPQVLVNVDGCTRWVRLKKMTFVESVEWDDGIKITSSEVYVLDVDSEPTTQTIIESTDCAPPPPE